LQSLLNKGQSCWAREMLDNHMHVHFLALNQLLSLFLLGSVQSLLNKGQSRWAKEMLDNVRKACCVAGVMALVPKDDDVLEVRSELMSNGSC
jgi:hypothetical protein